MNMELTEEQRESGLMTVEEVARRLRVSKMTVYRMIHGHTPGVRLEVVKVGTRFRVPVEVVERLHRARELDGM